MKFEKGIFTLILAISIPILGLISLFLIKVDLAENLFIHHDAKLYPLSRVLTVGQTFIASRNNLEALDIKFKKINTQNHKLAFDLKQGSLMGKSTSPINLNVKFNSGEIQSEKFYRFYFSPISDSQGKEFTFFLQAETATESASVSPIISKIDVYLNGKAYLNGRPQKGDVVFKPVYKTSLIRFISFYLNKIAFSKPKIFSKIPLLLLVFLLMANFTVLTVLLFLKASLILKSKKDLLKVVLGLIFIIIIIFILYYSPKKIFFLNGEQ